MLQVTLGQDRDGDTVGVEHFCCAVANAVTLRAVRCGEYCERPSCWTICLIHVRWARAILEFPQLALELGIPVSRQLSSRSFPKAQVPAAVFGEEGRPFVLSSHLGRALVVFIDATQVGMPPRP